MDFGIALNSDWDTAGEEGGAPADWSLNPESLFTASAIGAERDSAVRRAETAPTIMMEIATVSEDEIPESEMFRCMPEYHHFYYSQQPRDPRMPVPLKRRAPQPGVTSLLSGKSSLTGDITGAPRVATQANLVPGRVVTPATAATMFNDPAGVHLPPGSRIVYVTDAPKAVTPSTIYVMVPPGTATPPGATVIHAPPSFTIDPTRSTSGHTILQPPAALGNSPANVLVSANGQILVATPSHMTSSALQPLQPYHLATQLSLAAASPQQQQPQQQPQSGSPPMQSAATQQRSPNAAPSSKAQAAAAATTKSSSSSPPSSSKLGATQPASSAASNESVKHPLLQQYTDTKSTADWNVRLIAGHIPTFCRDQDGSRFLQKQLEQTDNVPIVWNEVYPIAGDLMCDVFGNYVIQKLFDTCDEERRLKLVQLLCGHVHKIATQTYGCRVLQKALDLVPAKHMHFILDELRGHVAECVFDQNANHVLQKCIERMPARSQFIADAFRADLLHLSCHAYGCRVLQKLFEACYYDEARVTENPYAPTDLKPLLREVLNRVDALVLNQFGNYVVQHGMSNSPKELQDKFIAVLTPRVFELSKSKFGSNVAEKVVDLGNDAVRSSVLDDLLRPTPSGSNQQLPIISMMTDAFANYVVQRLLDRCNPAQHARIMQAITPHAVTIMQATFGKHLLHRMEKMGLISLDSLKGSGGGTTSHHAAPSQSTSRDAESHGGTSTGGREHSAKTAKGKKGSKGGSEKRGGEAETTPAPPAVPAAATASQQTGAAHSLKSPPPPTAIAASDTPSVTNGIAPGARSLPVDAGKDSPECAALPRVATHTPYSLPPSSIQLLQLGSMDHVDGNIPVVGSNQIHYVTTTQTYAVLPHGGAVPVEQHTSYYVGSSAAQGVSAPPVQPSPAPVAAPQVVVAASQRTRHGAPHSTTGGAMYPALQSGASNPYSFSGAASYSQPLHAGQGMHPQQHGPQPIFSQESQHRQQNVVGPGLPPAVIGAPVPHTLYPPIVRVGAADAGQAPRIHYAASETRPPPPAGMY